MTERKKFSTWVLCYLVKYDSIHLEWCMGNGVKLDFRNLED